jgi:protein-S-isoprenylcysteine O-methyltransferase Ste14
MNRYPLLIVLVLLALCWFMSRFIPFPIGLGLSGKVAGLIMVLVGIFLLMIAVVAFMAIKTTVMPTRVPDNLVTGGVYRITRNPMYLGMLLILCGFPLMMDTLLGFICPVIFFSNGSYSHSREEKVEEDVFGKAYLAYKSHTRRWI